MADKNSFIANVNLIAAHLPSIKEANGYFSEEVIIVLREIIGLDLNELIQDLIKDSYLGNKKLDIDLKKNMKDSSGVGYSGATAYFYDGTVYKFNFTSDDQTTTEATNQGLIRQFDNNQGFKDKLVGTAYFGVPYEDEEGNVDPQIVLCVRFYPVLGQISNLSHIVLHASSGGYINANPLYSWTDTTSSLDVIANNISEILATMSAVEQLSAIAINITKLMDIQHYLPELVTNPMSIWELKDELLYIYSKREEILASKANADSAEISAGLAKMYSDQAKETVNRKATPTVLGSVYTASPQHIINGTSNQMVDAAQLKSVVDPLKREATVDELGLVQLAERRYVETLTGNPNAVITVGTLGAYIPSGSGGGGGTTIGIATDPTSGLMYYVLQGSSTKLLHMFGKLTAATASSVLIDLPSSLADVKNKSITGMVLNTPYTSFAVREDNTTITDLNRIRVGIWDGSTSAFVAGSFYVHIIAEISTGKLPNPPVGFSITSPQTGRMVITKS